MRLFVQIPCLNEEHTLPLVLASIPEEIPGIDEKSSAGGIATCASRRTASHSRC